MKHVIFLLTICVALISGIPDISSGCPLYPAGETPDGRKIYIGGFIPAAFVVVSRDTVSNDSQGISGCAIGAVGSIRSVDICAFMELQYGGILVPYVPDKEPSPWDGIH